MDPKSFLPEGCPYKEGAKLASTNAKVLDAKIYQRILGVEIELVPPLLKAPPLEKSDEPDPCDPTKTKGQKYIWMDSPSYFNIPVDRDFPFELDELDDPTDEEAPRLIQKKVGLMERFIKSFRFGSKPEKTILKVPNTIHNLGVLFKYPKNGNPSAYEYIWEAISAQHGNKRISPGRICMREDVIGRGASFAQQQETAAKAGVKIVELGHRILFNFLRHVEHAYPDGQNPWTYARTSTLTVDSQGTPSPSGCGGGGPSGLYVDYSSIAFDNVGVAVALPAEVQDIGS